MSYVIGSFKEGYSIFMLNTLGPVVVTRLLGELDEDYVFDTSVVWDKIKLVHDAESFEIIKSVADTVYEYDNRIYYMKLELAKLEAERGNVTDALVTVYKNIPDEPSARETYINRRMKELYGHLSGGDNGNL